MRGAVGADQAGAVNGKPDGQALQRDVVHDLIVGALQECRIDCDEGLVAFRRHARREGHRMLFCDPDVETALGKQFGKFINTGAGRHGCSYRHNSVVQFGLGEQGVGENAGIARRIGRRFFLCAGDDVEAGNAMILVIAVFRGRVAVAFARHDVKQYRAVQFAVADIAQHGQEVVEIVTVDRTDVIKAHFLEQRAARRHATGVFLGQASGAFDAVGEFLRHLLGDVA